MHPCQGWWYCWWGKVIHRKGQSYSRCFCFLFFLNFFMNGRYYSVSQKRDPLFICLAGWQKKNMFGIVMNEPGFCMELWI
jgi:hypothetical protein